MGIFGRKAPKAETLAKIPGLSKYLKGPLNSLPTPPSGIDYSVAAQSCLSQVMGNDTVGDCTCAGAGHALGLWTGNAGDLVTLTREQVLAMYSAITGYNPSDPSTDQGANEVDRS